MSYVLRLTNLILGISLLILLTRGLGAEKFGYYSLISLVIMFFVNMNQQYLKTQITQQVSEINALNLTVLNKYRRIIVLLLALEGLLVTILLDYYTIFSELKFGAYALFLASFLIWSVTFPIWEMQMRITGKLNKVFWLNCIHQICIILILFFTVMFTIETVLYVYAIINGLVLLYLIYFELSRRADIPKHLNFTTNAYYILSTSILNQGLPAALGMWIGLFGTMSEVGYFRILNRCANVSFFLGSINAMRFVYFVKAYTSSKRALRRLRLESFSIFLLMNVIAYVIYIVGDELILSILGKEYQSFHGYMVAMVIFAMSVNVLVGPIGEALVSEKRPREVLHARLLSVMVFMTLPFEWLNSSFFDQLTLIYCLYHISYAMILSIMYYSDGREI